VHYARAQWTALTRYLEDGDLAIDNNASERALRRVVTGRKNWLFCGSDEGGTRAAILYSVVATCKAHAIDVWAYQGRSSDDASDRRRAERCRQLKAARTGTQPQDASPSSRRLRNEAALCSVMFQPVAIPSRSVLYGWDGDCRRCATTDATI
jgi:hypothetical protein